MFRIVIALSIIFFEVGNLQMIYFSNFVNSFSIRITLNFLMANFFGRWWGLLGHSACMSSVIILVNYDTDVSPFAIFLIFSWPVADTGLAIWRRWSLRTNLSSRSSAFPSVGNAIS